MSEQQTLNQQYCKTCTAYPDNCQRCINWKREKDIEAIKASLDPLIHLDELIYEHHRPLLQKFITGIKATHSP